MIFLKNIRSFLWLILVVVFFSCSESINTPNEQAGMWSNAPAEKWQDGLVSGNGTMGILVLGDPGKEQIIFNHEECYEFTGTEDNPTPELVKYMPEIKRLMLEGKLREAAVYSSNMGEKEGWQSVWTDPYHPVLNMIIEQEIAGKYKDYARSTNFETGEIEVKWNDEQGSFQRKSFVSKPDKVVVQQLKGTAPINCKIKISDLINRKKINRKQVVIDLMLGEPELNVQENWVTYRVAYNLYGRGYETGTQIKVKNGSVKKVDNEIVITDASEVLLLIRINFLEDFSKSLLASTKDDLKSVGESYDTLLAKHAKVHGEIFNRVKLDIYDGPRHSSETLIANQKADPENVDPQFMETVFNMGRYTLISSSGKLPPNLSGIWQGDFRPAWCGDFTLDANVNLQIAGAAIGDLKEASDSYMKLLEQISPDWETNAKQLFGCEGYFAGARTSGRRGLANHWNTVASWHFWTSGAEWLLLPAYEYYQTSGDEAFLQERLLPMMKKTVQFYEGFLTEFDNNGDYLFIPSSSPENSPGNSRETCAAINATIDIAAAKEAIVNLITVCNDLNIEQKNIPKWQAMLAKFPPYSISNKGAIKEWCTPLLTENQAHRHISHLYPVWPGHEINPQDTPELFKAAKKAIRIREIGNGSAHGLAHRAFICARLKMDEELYDCIRYLHTEGYFYRSMFTGHNARPATYNADLINSYPAIIMEALVYSRPGIIELLPAWSHKLGNGKIEGVKCRTNATVDKLEWDFDNMIIKTTISSGKDQTFELSCKRGIDKVKCTGDYEIKSDNTISIRLKKGASIDLEINMTPTVIIDPSEKELNPGNRFTLSTKVLPAEESTQLKFTSSNKTVATVNQSGIVKAISIGSSEITATTPKGKTGKCKLTVLKYVKPAKIELVENGMIQKDGYLSVSCKYNTETGAVVNSKGARYVLYQKGSGLYKKRYLAIHDVNSAGTTEGITKVMLSLKDFPASKDLPFGSFYILKVILEDENGFSVEYNKRRLEIK